MRTASARGTKRAEGLWSQTLLAGARNRADSVLGFGPGGRAEACAHARAVRARLEGARGVGGCARGGGGSGTWGMGGGEGPGIQRPATSVPGPEPIPRAACGEGVVLCREVASGKRRPLLLPSWAHQAPVTDQKLGEPLAPSGEGRPVCFKKLCAPGVGISDPGCEEF